MGGRSGLSTGFYHCSPVPCTPVQGSGNVQRALLMENQVSSFLPLLPSGAISPASEGLRDQPSLPLCCCPAVAEHTNPTGSDSAHRAPAQPRAAHSCSSLSAPPSFPSRSLFLASLVWTGMKVAQSPTLPLAANSRRHWLSVRRLASGCAP